MWLTKFKYLCSEQSVKKAKVNLYVAFFFFSLPSTKHSFLWNSSESVTLYDWGKKSTGHSISCCNLLQIACYFRASELQVNQNKKYLYGLPFSTSFCDLLSFWLSFWMYNFSHLCDSLIFKIHIWIYFQMYISPNLLFLFLFSKCKYPNHISKVYYCYHPFEVLFFTCKFKCTTSPSGSQNYFWQCWRGILKSWIVLTYKREPIKLVDKELITELSPLYDPWSIYLISSSAEMLHNQCKHFSKSSESMVSFSLPLVKPYLSFKFWSKHHFLRETFDHILPLPQISSDTLVSTFCTFSS